MKKPQARKTGTSEGQRGPSELDQVLFSRKTAALVLIWVAVLAGLPVINRDHTTRSVPAPFSEPDHMTQAGRTARPGAEVRASRNRAVIAGMGARQEARGGEWQSNVEHLAITVPNERPEGAVTWWRGLSNDPGKLKTGLIVAYELSREYPEQALMLLSGLPPSQERDNAIVHAVRQWAATDADTATEWAFGVPDPWLRPRLIAAVATTLANVDGPRAAELAVANVEDQRELSRAVVVVAQEWAQNDRNAAYSWVSALPEGPLKKATEQALEAENAGQAGE